MSCGPLRVGITTVVLMVGVALATIGAQRPSACTAFIHATVVNPAAKPLPNATVIVCRDTIDAVADAGVGLPADARVIDARRLFLIPGLWDMHVHLDQIDEAAGPALVAAGVTSVRDAGSSFAVIRRWRERSAAGRLIAPHIKAAGTIFESPRFLTLLDRLARGLSPADRALLDGVTRDRTAVSDESSIDTGVAAVADGGADFIKVRNVERPEWLSRFAAAAKRRGLPLAAHVLPGVDLARASSDGVRSFEHYDYSSSVDAVADTAAGAALADTFTRNRTALVPTLITRESAAHPADEIQRLLQDGRALASGVSPRLLDLWRMKLALARLDPTPAAERRWQAGAAFVRMARRRGVTILAGTDLAVPFVYPGKGLIDELQLFVHQLNMSPADALAAATIEPARWFGIDATVGTIEPGRRADLVVLASNPLARIENLRDVRGVMLGGAYYPATELRRSSEP